MNQTSGRAGIPEPFKRSPWSSRPSSIPSNPKWASSIHATGPWLTPWSMSSPASSPTPSDPANLPSPSSENKSRLIRSWGYLEIGGHSSDHQGPLFRPLRGNAKPHDPAGRMDPDAIDRVLRKYAAEIGPAHSYSAHSMRATFITTALENGAQLEDVQKAAGHRDPSTTKLYDRRGYIHTDRRFRPSYGKSKRFLRPDPLHYVTAGSGQEKRMVLLRNPASTTSIPPDFTIHSSRWSRYSRCRSPEA